MNESRLLQQEVERSVVSYREKQGLKTRLLPHEAAEYIGCRYDKLMQMVGSGRSLSTGSGGAFFL